MAVKPSREIQAHRRTLIQAAKFAVRDIFDAIVELVTNSDDRYQVLNCDGVIEVEVERKRAKGTSVLRVRDFADGMDAGTMDRKLSFMGGRESGMDKGAEVRGTHSRGAKDIAALGRVMFESIAGDNRYHKCEITPYLDFILYDSVRVTKELRRNLGISEGTGTLVTIELEKNQRVSQHENLKDQIQRLVPLRGILRDERRRIVLRDLGQRREDELKVPRLGGSERVTESIEIPGYPGVKAKLMIFRSTERLDRESDRFRLGGIQVESKRAVHEATLFDSALEADTHALWFYGRLVCPYIDELCNEFDEKFESRLPQSDVNPTYPLDPSRKSGLNREHPFVRALFGEALKRLRPLVEEERRREEHERARIESAATRRRLVALEKAALDFMRDFGDEEDTARDPDGQHPESRFMERGYALSPPFAQMIVGHSRLFWVSIKQAAFPEFQVGDPVQVECLSTEIDADKSYCGLELHPSRAGVLRAAWKVRALSATEATGLRVRVGEITAESAIEVFASEADQYRDVAGLQFARKRYQMRTDQKHKKIRILAPIHMAPRPAQIQVSIDSERFRFSGEPVLQPNQHLKVALCELSVTSNGKDGSAVLSARLGEAETTAMITAAAPLGAELSILIEDIDLGNQRYRWRKNILEIAARHPSLERYLGRDQEGFPGQETKHFRVLIAEVVADAVCALIVRRKVQSNPEDFEDADWDTYYAEYSKLMTAFLPKAHLLQCPE